MKMRRLILEETQGLDSFMEKLIETYPKVKEFSDVMKKFIEDSDCKKIEFSKFKMGVLGVALHNGVLINEVTLKNSLIHTIFVIFHEVAHQYQFKKYGDVMMYDCYNDEVDIKEAADFMKKTEMVADEFAIRKLKQLERMGLIEVKTFPSGYYKNIPTQQLENMVNGIRMGLRQQGKKSPEEISEYFYNIVKVEI